MPGEKPSQLHTLWPLIVILAIGAAVRLWWLQNVPTQPVTDFLWYFDRAAALARGEGYSVDGVPTAYWPVGYPYALSLLFRFTGPSVLAAQILNSALTLACTALAYLLAHRLTADRAAAALAALLLALHPSFVAYSGILAAEPLYTALLLLACLAATHALPRPGHWLPVGIWAGLATLVRPQAVLTPILLALSAHLLTPRRDRRKAKVWLGSAGALLALALVLTPWTIRNYQTHGQFVFVSTNGGDNLWIGNHPQTTGRYQTPPGKPAPPDQEIANDQAARQAALESLQTNPAPALAAWPTKLQATFLSGTDAPYWAFQTQMGQLVTPGLGPERELFLAFRQANQAAVNGLLAAASLGLLFALASERGRRLAILALPQIAIAALVTLVFFGNGRFGFPTLPFQALLVAAIPASLGEWFGRSNPSDPLVGED